MEVTERPERIEYDARHDLDLTDKRRFW
jgi:hypothetical protein